ncbi:MAG: PIN domain-containing protein [Azoarcus sp.]|jgi:predicted nucleic acid-binding protein|nr:PIN domain-containing protein [Azoarcus sp.]
MSGFPTFDTNTLIDLYSNKDNAKTRKEQIQSFVNAIKKARGQILIPAPVFAEFAVKANEDEIQEILNDRTFVIADFNKKSALECSFILRNELVKKRNKKENKIKVKFDVQILSIAKANEAEVLITDDTHLINLASKHGVLTKTVNNLPPPDPVQEYLFDSKQ